MSAGDPIVRWVAALVLLVAVSYLVSGVRRAKETEGVKSLWLGLRASLLANQGILKRRESPLLVHSRLA